MRVFVLLGIVTLAGCSTARGPTADLELTASGRGAVLEVTWHNRSAAVIHVETHVFAGEKHFDNISVTLSHGGSSRKLSFVMDRDESAPVRVALEPGASTSEAIDLQAWASRKANGGSPLASGRHDAAVVYEARGGRAWQGRLSASTAIDVP